MGNPRINTIIIQAAEEIGTVPEWLDALIDFETGGTYDPMQIGFDPHARGLIQFRNSTARDMGYRDSTHLVVSHPTFEDQMLNAVVPYFKMRQSSHNIGHYDTLQALTMAVFYPAYWNVPPNTQFPEVVRKNNPGINTPGDYMAMVEKRMKGELKPSPFAIPAPLILAAAGALVYILIQGSKR